MKYDKGKIVVWDGGDGILVRGHRYRVKQIRKGRRGQEFTLEYMNGHEVEPLTWFEAGQPFHYPRVAV